MAAYVIPLYTYTFTAVVVRYSSNVVELLVGSW